MIEPGANFPAVEARFGLNKSPFGECIDESFFFPGEQHLRALEFMGHSVWTRARLGVVTAPQGCGKSVLIGHLLRNLDERVLAAEVSRERLGPREFLLEVLRQFGFALEDNDKTDRRRLLERFLHHQGSSGRVCLLIVENAQSMHPSVLEELRHLAAVEVDGIRTLKVLLLGQPALNHVLESPRMSELTAMGMPRFALGPLNEDQTAAYVAHRLRAAGARNPDALMPYTLTPQIYACTGGVPAEINRLCQQALICAARDPALGVTESALEEAIVAAGMEDRALRIEMPELPVDEEPTLVGEDFREEAMLLVSMQGVPEYRMTLGDDRLLIGRGEEADVRIDSVFVSRYHALIVRNGGHDLLLDLGSTNGVLVNSRRVVRHVLRHRDLVQVGPARATYLHPQVVPQAAPDPEETIRFARPGFSMAAGEEEYESGSPVLAFGRQDTSAER
jgi:type II secretory pathway predicted ATPase ExeA